MAKTDQMTAAAMALADSGFQGSLPPDEPRLCSCGDRLTPGEPHECWMALKLRTQENLEEPEDRTPPVFRHSVNVRDVR